jgi:autotransporter-associated beta strand protein
MFRRLAPVAWLRFVVLAALAASVHEASGQRQMERLGRGLVAVRTGTSTAYVGWRLLASDPDGVGFNVYRSQGGGAATRLNSQPITNTTDYVDASATLTVSNSWFVRAVSNGVELESCRPFGVAANAAIPTDFQGKLAAYLSISLQTLSDTYVHHCWPGDLEGDGEYDFVVSRLPNSSGPSFLEAYLRDGTFLWRMNMGYNSTNSSSDFPPSGISVGHSDNVTVYDLDGDGKAEVLVRTANGVTVTNAAGAQVAAMTATNDVVQYLSVIDGLTGAERARMTLTNPVPAAGALSSHMGIFYGDGLKPSLVCEAINRNSDGTFNLIVICWDYRDGKLTQRWAWQPPNDGKNYSRAHQIRIADVDHDGKDEICEIGFVLHDDGDHATPLYSTELLHGDRYQIGDLDPDRPGLETYAIQQDNPTLLASALLDAGNGKSFKKWFTSSVTDIARGNAGDVDIGTRGVEVFCTLPGLYSCKGDKVSDSPPYPNFSIWWDSDILREQLDDGKISKNGARLLSPYYMTSPAKNGLPTWRNAQPLYGDLFGDWREEVLFESSDHSNLVIFTTVAAATNRLVCLAQDPEYRECLTVKGYMQTTWPSYYIGGGMEPPAPAPQVAALKVWRGDVNATWDLGSANWRTNWVFAGTNIANAATYSDGDSVLFDLSGSNSAAIALSGVLSPGEVTVYAPKDFVFDGSSGLLSGSMRLVKAGGGGLTLSGTNTYTGQTLVWEGALVLVGGLTSSPLSVRGGVWLDGALCGNGWAGQGATIFRGASISPGAGSNQPGTLTISNSLTLADGSFCRFDLSDDPTGISRSNDLVVVRGNLLVSGTNHLVITRMNTNLPPGGVYPLIQYSGSFIGGLSNFDIQGLSGVPVELTNPAGQIALVAKGYRSASTVVWAGGQGAGSWDLLSSSNWLNSSIRDVFAPNDSVRFDDSSGASNAVVSLAGELNPANIIVGSASNYVFAGNGSIIGSTGLLKTNSGMLTISNLNHTFTGKTIVAGGTLVVSELDAVGFPSPLGNPAGGATNLVLSNSATLSIIAESYTDRGMTLGPGTNSLDISAQLTLAGTITGSGALQKLGSGTLTITGSNGYSGGTLIRAGTVSFGGDAANQYGFGTSGTVTLNSGTIVMYSDTSSYNSTYWNLVVPSGGTGTLYTDDRCYLRGALTGAGTFNYNVNYVRAELDGDWSGFAGQINVYTPDGGGDFRINNSYGYAGAALYLASGINAYHMTSSTAVSLGALSGDVGASLSGGAWSIGGRNLDSTFAGSVTGSSLTKVGGGILTLNGINSYTGATTVNAGTLLVNSNSAAASGTVAVGTSGTLGGTGIIGGASTINGKLSPGSGGIGTLTFTNTLTLGSSSTTMIKLNKGAATNDAVAVSNALSFAGTLQVSNLSGAIAAGDSFKIFSARTYSGGFSGFSLPVLANAVWVTSNLTLNGTLSVAAGTNPINSVVWKGDGQNNLWDVAGSANWLDTNGVVTTYTNGQSVSFSDAGSNNTVITLATNVQPGPLSINAAKDYAWTGASIDGTNGLAKSGTGTLTLLNSNRFGGGSIIYGGSLVLGSKYGLSHRWSFNGSLADSVGSNAATVVEVGSSNVTLGVSNITLAGGARTSADYVSLGSSLLPNSTNPVTIELWATQNAVQNWARIFDFGSATSENLFMSWSSGTTLTNDRVEWLDVATSTADGTCQPYSLGAEFHIAMVLVPGGGANGTTRVMWYRAPVTNSVLGNVRGSFDSTNTLAGFTQTNCWLGRSEYSGDYTASATYDEVRIWTRALSAGELQWNHQLGPDTLPAGSLPAGGAVSLAGASAILDNRSGAAQSVGALSGVAGSQIKLSQGGLVVGVDNSSRTFAGSISGSNRLTKAGSGAWTLSGSNGLTGGCVLSNGSLLLNGALTGSAITAYGGTLGGNGTIAGASLVRAGATLSPGCGDFGMLTFSNLSLFAGATNYFEISHAQQTNDRVRVTGTLTNGGTLLVTNLAGALSAGDSFKLFEASLYCGEFSAVTLPSLAVGLVWNTNLLTSGGTISVGFLSSPSISRITMRTSGVECSGSGGVGNASYYVLSATNLALPLSNWSRVATNQFDNLGAFVFTNTVGGNLSSQFFRIQLQ